MALMVTAFPPSRFRPPPDPPPYEFHLVEGLSLITPPEPPDPPDAVYLFTPLQILNTFAKPSLQEFTQTFVVMLACPIMVTERSMVVVLLLCQPVTLLSPMGVYFLWYTCLIVEARTGLLSDFISDFLFRLLVRFSRFTFTYHSQLTFILLKGLE